MKRYEQAKADYEYLVSHHGADVYDLTGGYVAEDEYFKLLRNPSKKNAWLHYCALIQHFATVGYEPSNNDNAGKRPDFEDEEVCEIFRRNCDEDTVMTFWGIDIYEKNNQ